MTPAEFQKLARERIADAKVLLAAKRWAAAYYLAGYAVACGLKSCVLAHVAGAAEVIFKDRKYSEKCWTHNLTQLVDLSGLTAALGAATRSDPTLFAEAVAAIRDRYPGRSPTWLRGGRLGELGVEAACIYPRVTAEATTASS